MTLSELTHNQLLALVALIETVAESGDAVTDAEQDGIDTIVDELGEQTYRDLIEEADDRFGNEDDLKAFLEDITDRHARELIYGTVLDEAMAEPTAHGRTGELLRWLAQAWNIAVEVDGGEEGED
jgi:hypothetical protein